MVKSSTHCNFDNPTSEPYSGFFSGLFRHRQCCGRSPLARKAGLFDTRFQLYGWEDLELGVRLKQLGLKLIKCPTVGYHWHPPFALEQIPV